jgi:hypothetical protein
MQPFETRGERPAAEAPPPALEQRDPAGTVTAAQAGTIWTRPAPHLHTTRGGAGSTAGATPKKSYRPSASRPRPAGKKPEHGRR